MREETGDKLPREPRARGGAGRVAVRAARGAVRDHFVEERCGVRLVHSERELAVRLRAQDHFENVRLHGAAGGAAAAALGGGAERRLRGGLCVLAGKLSVSGLPAVPAQVAFYLFII